MGKPSHPLSWTPHIKDRTGPLYLAIADAIATDITSSKLQPGARLPAQRALADQLGIDFTTVTRAYAEAGKRGLVEGRVGHGTYVRQKQKPVISGAGARSIDVSMNIPPHFTDADLERRMESSASSVAGEGLDLFLTYQDPAGAMADRRAGAAWLSSRLPGVSPDRVIVCPGGQGALAAMLNFLTQPGDTICAESLTYPGLITLAAHLGVQVTGIEMDDEGLLPESLEAVCKSRRPKLLYCTPTLQNPTTSTMSLARRERVADIARRHQLQIIEDDAYGALPAKSLKPLAAFAPDITFYIGGLAKCLSPALRIAYLALPDARTASRAANAIRAFSGMASPLTAAIATRWLEDGTADAVLSAIRKETAHRRQAAVDILPSAVTKPDCFHAWLTLPEGWAASTLALRARAEGVGLVAADTFAISSKAEAVRLGLGAPRTVHDLAQGLEIIADLIARPSNASSLIV